MGSFIVTKIQNMKDVGFSLLVIITIIYLTSPFPSHVD